MKKSTLVAFAVLVGLVGVVYWLDDDDGSSADVEHVFDVTEDAIHRVEIRRLGNEPTVMERDGERFRLIAPVDAATDERAVDLVLSNLATMTAVRSFAPDIDTDVTEYGLDNPELEVHFVTADGGEAAIRFGKDTLTPSNQYAERVGVDEVLVVATHLATNLDKTAWDLRDKAIFHLPEDAEPERVTIAHGTETVELGDEGGVWMTTDSPRVRVDQFAVTGMVARFRRADMLALADVNADTGGDSPTRRLEVSFRGEPGGIAPMSLEIGNQKNVDYYARVPSQDQVFLIEGGLVDELRGSASDWWSKKLLHHPTTEDTAVRIASADGEERSLDRDEAQILLRALSAATADEVVARIPSGETAYVITVTTNDSEDEITLRLEGGVAYATRQSEDVTLRLPAEAWMSIDAELQTGAN